jgi:Protein of unknown function (DUF3987)
MSGSLAEFARFMAEGTEVPEEFYFAAALTFCGATCGTRLCLDAALGIEPRLFTVLLGESADVKKSTALRNTANFFRLAWQMLMEYPTICDGVGSAEGLAKRLSTSEHGIVLCCDELKALIEKTRIESSILLPMLSSLFEQNCYENSTKNHDLKLENAHLSIVGCCTSDTYASMWDRQSIAIGFPNRLFVVLADRRRKVSWPAKRDAAALDALRDKVVSQLRRLPLCLSIEPDAREAWDTWYNAVPGSVHAKRLDSIGFRLLMLLALTNDKSIIDLDTVRRVTAILDYELDVRTVTDPLDADNLIASLEQRIIKQLETRGPLWRNQLWKYVNGSRAGVWFFERAIANLKAAEHIWERCGGKSKQYHLRPEESHEESSG